MDDRYRRHPGTGRRQSPQRDGRRCVEVHDIRSFPDQDLAQSTERSKVCPQSISAKWWQVVGSVEALKAFRAACNGDGFPALCLERQGDR